MTTINAIAPILIETHVQIMKVIDGDSLIVSSIFRKSEKEIRLYGVDAPESKINRKLKEDEQKIQIAGQLLIQLGQLATKFVLTIAPPGTNITLITEEDNFYDFYKRQLAYVILPDGRYLNEVLIQSGYAKPYSEYYCKMLPEYQRINFAVMQARQGLYAFTPRF